MTSRLPITRVLAVASHVTYGYVGNKMVSFVLQALGCEVSAINTVHFSNHTAYKYFRGRKTPASEIQELYDALKHNSLTNFDIMLSGYTGSKEAVQTVGNIGRELREIAGSESRAFFWILDPVMGDEGRLYVDAAILPVYKSLLPHADLILPNCFEAEILSDVKISDRPSLTRAVQKLHQEYRTPHIIVTSVRSSEKKDTLAVFGSSSRSDGTPRLFSVETPALPVQFAGTGDMFAALMLVRLRDASSDYQAQKSWQPPDSLCATDLPLAKATEKTMASMHAVLIRTMVEREEELAPVAAEKGSFYSIKNSLDPALPTSMAEQTFHVLKTRASEVRVLHGADDLRNPDLTQTNGVTFQAREVHA